jgi:hypothetical protein
MSVVQGEERKKMKHLLKSLSFFALLAGFAGMASAADVQGILMDKMCSAKAVKGGQAAAIAHDRDCALMPPCQQSGYGVFTADNKYLTFDDAGNTKAIAALKKSKTKDDLKVTVTGDVKGDTISASPVCGTWPNLPPLSDTGALRLNSSTLMTWSTSFPRIAVCSPRVTHLHLLPRGR